MSQTAEETPIRTLSPHEQMSFAGLDHYFKVGRSALDCIRDGLRAAGKEEAGDPPFGVRTILDLPCGQGRVLRWLRSAFPDAEIAACDMSREGVDFCEETFGAVPIYSVDDPEEIPLPRDHYDLIWVGSLFTHLDGPKWGRFLRVYQQALRPGGVLIFTTHGTRAQKYMASRAFLYGHDEASLDELLAIYEAEGFGYIRYAGMEWNYGTTLSRPDWVIDQVRNTPGLTFIRYGEHAWDDHQDCYVCRRDG